MALEEVCHNKRKKLYSDLFKPSAAAAPEKEEQSMVISSGHSSWVSTTSSSSPSSGLSTPFFSDFESDEEGDDFMAELTRQMAECMLQEEEEEEEEEHEIDAAAAEEKIIKSHLQKKKNEEQGCVVQDFGGAIKNGFNSGPLGADSGNGILPFQVYELKNQPAVRKEGNFNRGKRVKGTESARQKTQQQQQHNRQQQQQQYRGGGLNGSGMQAVFLGGSKSLTGPPGTGVFLPRVATDPAEIKKKPGCSIVLMPTRVLQALEQHFKQRQQQHSTTLLSGAGGGSLIHSCPAKDESNIPNGQLEKTKRLGCSEEVMQLPQEWTY